MKAKLLVLNHAYLFFGTTLYVGTLWALHFFWFPSWEHLKVDNYYDQFIPQTQAATRFFTYVVPLMFLTSLIMIKSEWKTRFRWLAIGALACLSGATYVGQALIIPINKTLTVPVTDQAQLTAYLEHWISYNNIRWMLLTIMWLLMMWYFIAKPNLTQALGESKG